MVAEVSTTANPSAASAVDTVAREGHTQKQPARVYLSLALGVTCIGFSAIFTKWANVDGAVAGLDRVGIATIVLGVPFLFQLLRRKGRGETLAAGGVGLRTLLGITAMA